MEDNQDIIKTDVFQINLATNQLPSYSVNERLGVIEQGAKNDYSNYLLFLFNNHAEHGAIVRGKASYVSGLSIKPKDENPTVQSFLNRANPSESFYEVLVKSDLDDAAFGGHYLKIETNAIGTPINWYHIEYPKVRISKDFQNFVVCEDWSREKSWQMEKETYPAYKPGYVGTSVYYCKRYSPSISKIQSAYPQPEYMSCTLDIDTDIRVGSFFNNYVRNNFSSGTMITIFNGETDPVKKENIVTRIKHEHTGEDEAGKPVVVFAPKDGKGAEVLTLNASDLDKQYVEVSKRNKEKIVAGHGVNGALFKVKMDDKALFSRAELVEQHELFLNEYVKVKQVEKLSKLAKWCKIVTGVDAEFEIEQVEPIGLELPLDNQNVVAALNAKDPNIITDYIINKYALKVPETLGANGLPVTTPTAVAQETNDSLKGLSAADNADMYRIVRDYTKGKINQHLAMTRLKAYGIDEATAKKILGIDESVQQSAQDKNKRVKELFLKYAHEIEESEVLEVIPYNAVNFSDETDVTTNQLRSAVLDALKGNPFLTDEELAKLLGVTVVVVGAALTWLITKNLIEAGEGSFQPTEKAMGKETEPIETEIVTEYTYEKRPDVDGPILLPTSRQDCIDWVKLTRTHAITYEAIRKLENEFGEEAWQFRGGFWNNDGVIEPFCRHYWEGHTKIRKKK